MKRFSKYPTFRCLATLVTAWVAALTLASCVNESSPCQEPDGDAGDKVYLRFTLFTMGDGGKRTAPATKAADISGDIAGDEYENLINLGKNGDGLTYYLFDANQRFVADISPKSTTKLLEVEGGTRQTYQFYEVVSEIDKDLINTSATISSFYILAAANYGDWFNGSSLDSPFTMTAPAVGTTIEKYLSDNSGFVMTKLPYTNKLRHYGDEDVYKWMPGGAYFPLAGLQKFEVQSAMLQTSSQNSPFDISLASGKDLNMLRTFAKIEVIDKINVNGTYNPEVDGSYFGEPGNPADQDIENAKLRIHKLEMLGMMNRGSLFPAMNQWNRNSVFETQQVIAPTIPTSAKYIPAPEYIRQGDTYVGGENSITDGYPDQYATDIREDRCPVFSLYIYEYSRLADQLKNVPASQRPYLRVTLRGSADEETEVESMLLPIWMELYDSNDQSYTPGTYIESILRNHIYRYEVTGISQDATLVWKLCDMDNLNADITFN